MFFSKIMQLWNVLVSSLVIIWLILIIWLKYIEIVQRCVVLLYLDDTTIIQPVLGR